MATAREGECSAPPMLTDDTVYEDWLKDLEVWKLFTNTPDTKKGPRLYLNLKGKARELVRSIPTAQIGSETGLYVIVAKLNEHYQKDKVQRSYLELEAFEGYRRKSDCDIQSYITEFERLNNKINEHGMILPDGVLAYKLLHHANLQTRDVNLIKATMSELKYEEM